nr:MAG TPA: hypothetical protein [Caudoviricetes sp.]DAT95917.1 MAG TPA: hypothetical protein [Caudoviricetes sp.]
MSYNIIRRGPPLLRPVHPTSAKVQIKIETAKNDKKCKIER